MYHLLTGLYEHLTRKDEYSVVIIGLDNVSSSSESTVRLLLLIVAYSLHHTTGRKDRMSKMLMGNFRQADSCFRGLIATDHARKDQDAVQSYSRNAC